MSAPAAMRQTTQNMGMLTKKSKTLIRDGATQQR
jgi:hypothetical protein